MKWAGLQPGHAMRVLWLVLLTLVAGCASADEVVQFASPASSPGPVYPSLSKRLGEEGSVMLRVRVLASGDAGEVQLHKSSGFERLDAAAVTAVKQFKFNPARTRSGQAVDSWVTVPLQYVLK
ncbi:energy transducer TonB [Polaromonas aquatica]|uniref:energy transducer TonB n=1 Tax=Polaromonas aquatica TaxID=332657 RepID=UPI003D64A70B